MDDSIEARLARLGVTLPESAPPAANYLPAVQWGELLFISGQLPRNPDGTIVRGRLGESISPDDARQAARLSAINVLGQAKLALGGDLSRIRQIVRITVFVASSPDFFDQHVIANGASDFLADALGAAGRHARAAIGVAALPLGAAVEVDAVVAVD